MGVDAGVEVALVGRRFLSLTVGWAHPVYRGVDLDLMYTYPRQQPRQPDSPTDTFRFKLGLGL